MPRFAANLGLLFTERPLIERFAAAAAAGFPAVEVQLPYEQPAPAIKAELDRHGLAMLGINTARGKPGEFGLAAVPGREAEFAGLFAQALGYAVAIGARAIHCLAGTVSPERRPAADATFVSNLTRVEHAAEVIARVGRPNVKVQFDCYHVQIMQGDLIKRLERFLPLIGHVQIAAVPSRAEPDEGEVNYIAVCDALDAMGYAGWIGAEYRPRASTEAGLSWARRYGIVPKRA